MTFETIEASIQDGAPVEIYEFQRDSLRWRYTSSQDNVTIDGNTYTATQINRSAIENTSAADKSMIKVDVPRDNPVADMFRIAPPSDVVMLYVYRYHYADNDKRVMWIGKVLNVEWRGAIATLSCEPVTISLNRIGLRRTYQRGCPHVLYGSKCGVTRATYEVTGPVDSVSGKVVSVSEADALADGYFNGGGLEWTAISGATERRMITDHTGAALTLTIPISGLTVGATVKIFPGCPKTTSACLSKFNNLDNYGGFPYVPTDNPFDKSLSN